MQETRRFRPSAVSRRFSVVAGFYRTCALDGVLSHSPAEHVRRPSATPPLPTSFDVGADLRDVQLAARHADPRTTMRYDRARNNLDRHPNYILASYMASGT